MCLSIASNLEEFVFSKDRDVRDIDPSTCRDFQWYVHRPSFVVRLAPYPHDFPFSVKDKLTIDDTCTKTFVERKQ